MKAIPSAPSASPGIKRVKEAIIYFYQVNRKLGSFTFFFPHASLRKKKIISLEIMISSAELKIKK